VSGAGSYLSAAERAARGKAARTSAPRSSHATFDTSFLSRDPIELLERQAASWEPDLVPIRYGRMLVSPFAFFRGAALVMASDLSGTPASGFPVQLCGDAHLSNFGLFGSPDGRQVFDLSDFDETLPGPWEWDVKRLATSLVVAARENGFGWKDRRAIVLACAGRYREAMREYAAMRNLEVWYAHLEDEAVQAELAVQLDAGQRKRLTKSPARARTRESTQPLDKLARVVGEGRRIVADPPLIVPLRDLLPDVMRERLEHRLRGLIRQYGRSLQPERRVLIEQFRVVDIARKVVGVGGVGPRTWIVLLLGRDDQDPLFLQAKDAQPSLLSEFAGKSPYANEGQRVVAGQRLMQAANDVFLGWARVTELDGQQRDMYVRQLQDWKAAASVEAMPVESMRWYGALCGSALARAHARSGDRIAIAAYLGAGEVFDQALVEFAEAYADQNERDYQAFVAAVDAGRIAAQPGR
jgi:uncharacterized protein (DUF2252 family)